jgi:hypothetical protein
MPLRHGERGVAEHLPSIPVQNGRLLTGISLYRRFPMRSTFNFLLVAGAVLAASPAAAADIKEAAPIPIADEQVQKITVSGPIQPGDAVRLQKLISDEGGTIVSLSGEGGDYAEALAIAKLLHETPAMTIVEDGASCVGPCAIAFLGGTGEAEEESDSAIARSIALSARLAFQAPALGLADTGLTKQAAEDAYRKALAGIGDFLRASKDYGLDAAAAADVMSAGEPYVVNNAYRLAHLGVEVQKVAPASVLTLSMAKNLCRAGWQNSEKEADNGIDQVMTKLNWKAADATFVAKTDYFGDGVEVKRTVMPFDMAGEDSDSGYDFCLVDQAKVDGVLQVACRGFIYGQTLDDVMQRARGFDGPDAGTYGEADEDCDLPTGTEPLTVDQSTPQDRWALVPGNTPLDKISETLAGYAAKEPPL